MLSTSGGTQLFFQMGGTNSLTRKSLVTSEAEQDGGAHVDKLLAEPYARMSRDDSLNWNVLALDSGIERSAALVSIRQIAHEVLMTLKTGYSKTRPVEIGRAHV